MFMLCGSMKWNHLPVPGGLYDQHPKFLDDMYFIFQKRSEKEAADEAKRRQEQARAARKRK